ncbi:MAG: hypothetical protein ACRBF0_13315 [Calditrichia bacterium]
MGYLVTQIWLCLLLAFLLGLLIGWLIARWSNKNKITYLENIWKANLYSREEDLKTANVELDTLRLKIADLESRPVVAAGPVFPDEATEVRDDLKLIYGVGPFIEKRLNELGIMKFRHVAQFTDDKIDEIKDQIGPFKERIRRDGWVKHAQMLYKEKYGKDLS